MREERNHGLDVIRSFAIIMVLVSHSIYFFPGSSTLLGENNWRLEIFGYYGVELFFVLSGFLIGRILLQTFLETHGPYSAGKRLVNFYLRRWYRTLPLYYLMLLINIFFWTYIGNLDPQLARSIDWRHVVFLQNYSPSAVSFFPESWSLSVEEWYYLFFPLYILLYLNIAKGFGQKVRSMQGIVLFILLIIGIRCLYVYYYNPVFDFGIRKNIFLRLDSLAIGVLVGFWAMYKPRLFQWLAGACCQRFAWTMLAGVAFYFGLVNWEGWNNSFFARTVMIDLVSGSFAILLAGAYSKNLSYSTFFNTISKLTYSIYLVHFPIFTFLALVAAKTHQVWISACFLVFALCATYCVAKLLYRYYEKPLMNLRPNELAKITGKIS